MIYSYISGNTLGYCRNYQSFWRGYILSTVMRRIINKGSKMEMEYLLRHSKELSMYFGKCIAIVRDELVAAGKDRLEVYLFVMSSLTSSSSSFRVSQRNTRYETAPRLMERDRINNGER